MTVDPAAKLISSTRFSHTLFAIPFAIVGYVYGLLHSETPNNWLLLAGIIFCLVFARNTALGFNRWVDRKLEKESLKNANPDTAAENISTRTLLLFAIANAIGFIIVCYFINRLTLLLSPVALLVITGYSFTKRFTAWAHIILGTALALAPIGAYIAVTGSIAVVPIVLAGIVVTWVSGFDILYSLRYSDLAHSSEQAQHSTSVPPHLSTIGTIWISIILHLITIYAVIILGLYCQAGISYWIGSSLFIAVILVQYFLLLPVRAHHTLASFGYLNGIASLIFALCAIADMLIL